MYDKSTAMQPRSPQKSRPPGPVHLADARHTAAHGISGHKMKPGRDFRLCAGFRPPGFRPIHASYGRRPGRHPAGAGPVVAGCAWLDQLTASPLLLQTANVAVARLGRGGTTWGQYGPGEHGLPQWPKEAPPAGPMPSGGSAFKAGN
jgi:hypothetical protein